MAKKLTRAQRRRRQQRRALYDPSAPLAGQNLRRSANQLTQLQYRPQEQALGRQRDRISTQGTALTGRAGDYYKQLAAQEATRLARQQAIASQLDQRISAAGATAQQAAQQQATQLQAAQQADISLRGGGLTGGVDPTAEAHLAATRAAGATGLARQAGALESANAQTYGESAGRATQARGGETMQRLLNQIAQQQQAIRDKQTDLAAEKGAARAKNVLDLRQQGFTNAATAAGLDIKRSDLQAQIGSDAADRRLARRRITSAERQNNARLGVTKRGQDLTAAQRAADRQARRDIAGGKKKAEPADARKMKTGITNAASDIGTLTGRGLSAQQRAALKDAGATDLIRSGRLDINTARKVIIALGGPPVVAAAAAELSKYGRLRASTVAQLKRLGVRIPKGWLPLRKQPRTGGSPGSGAAGYPSGTGAGQVH
jgi:hypothetical protein